MDSNCHRYFSGECETAFDAIQSITKDPTYDQSFFVCDLADVINKIRVWKAKLPGIRPFYAVKANPDPVVLSLMISLGLGFDCASKKEISDVLFLGGKPQDIIYAHPQKIPSHLRHATAREVDVMTFDCESELPKIKAISPNARLVLRFKVPNVPAAFQLNDKFGCALKQCRGLLESAKKLNLNVIGVAFHVGSMCEQPSAYLKAIGMSRQIFDIAESLGYHFTLLDMGGGFPGHNGSYEIFDEMCDYIKQGLERYFSKHKDLQVIAEPGTYLINSALTLCTTVIGKKLSPKNVKNGKIEESKMMYYLNNSVYISFPEGWTTGGYRMSVSLSEKELAYRPVILSKLWGCSCCSADCILDECPLPELEMGEHVYFENMGAYAIPLSTNFNGFEKPAVHYIYTTLKNNDYQMAVPDEELTVSWISMLKLSNYCEPAIQQQHHEKDVFAAKNTNNIMTHMEPKLRS